MKFDFSNIYSKRQESGTFTMCIADNINIYIRGYKVKLKKNNTCH